MIEISEFTHPGAFATKSHTVTQAHDGLMHWMLTGIVTLPDEITGTGPSWNDTAVKLTIELPGIGHKDVRLLQCAPFVTLSSIKNDHHAMNAGWAVNSFKVVDPGSPSPGISLLCHLSVRDMDGGILRLGYVINAIGSVVEHSPDA
ncbi:MAG TPA: hypothetical protein VN367_07570 [Chlorobaculum sp.]|nr:hypothetical protein [Chlorobaculum sp.]